MSYELVVDNKKHFPLATIRGWKNVCDWSEDNQQWGTLYDFTRTNETGNPLLLSDEVMQVLRGDNLPDDVRSTLQFMVGSLRRGQVSAFVSDGVS